MGEWDEVRLADVVDIKHGYAFPGHGFSDNPEYPTLVTPGNFAIGGGFQASKAKTFSGGYPSEFQLRAGDLIITMTDLSREGNTLGLPAIIPSGGTFLHNQRIGLVKIIDPELVDRIFLNYFLRIKRYHAHVLGTASGSTVRHTSPGRIRDFTAKLPSVREQRAIAHVLSTLDDKIANNDQSCWLSNQLAHAVYNRAAARGRNTTIGNVAQLITRGVAPKYTDSEGTIVLNQKCIRDRRVSLAPARRTVPLKTRLDRLLQRHDVLVNSTGQGTLGRTARWMNNVTATADSHISIVRFNDDLIDPVCAGFGLLQIEDQIEALAEGSTGQTELKRDLLSGLEIMVPARAEQRAIGSEIALLDELAIGLRSESEQLAATRDDLLPLLMSGKLRVRDAEKAVEEVV